MFWPCETRTSTCRSFATISSGFYRFLAITVLLDVKDIPQVGPLQWERIRPARPEDRYRAAAVWINAYIACGGLAAAGAMRCELGRTSVIGHSLMAQGQTVDSLVRKIWGACARRYIDPAGLV